MNVESSPRRFAPHRVSEIAGDVIEPGENVAVEIDGRQWRSTAGSGDRRQAVEIDGSVNRTIIDG